MAIFERGYRPYEGTYTRRPAWWVIARDGWARAFKHLAVKLIGIFVLLVLGGHVIFVSVTLGFGEQLGEAGQRLGVVEAFRDASRTLLHTAHRSYVEFTTFLVMLAGVFVGSALISDDIRSRALTLYLVRPLGRLDYVVGKALVLPGILLLLGLVPSLLLWGAVGLWQPPGETMAFFEATSDVGHRALKYYAQMACAMTGLMLLIGSLTPRRGVALSVAAATLVLGTPLASVGTRLSGLLGELVGATALPRSLMRDIRSVSIWRMNRRWLPEPDAIWAVCLGLLLIGMVAVVRRTRSVEVG